VPEQGFNFQELARQLGLKNIDEMPVVRALTPSVTFADASQIGPPMLPPSAWAGGVIGITAGERANLQLLVVGSGGAFVEFFHSGGSIQVGFDVSRDGLDPLAVDPLPTAGIVKHETGFGTTASVVRIGTSTVALTPTTSPVFFTAVSFAEWGGPGFFVPSGGIFTFNNNALATVGYFAIRWREVPAPALTPSG